MTHTNTDIITTLRAICAHEIPEVESPTLYEMMDTLRMGLFTDDVQRALEVAVSDWEAEYGVSLQMLSDIDYPEWVDQSTVKSVEDGVEDFLQWCRDVVYMPAVHYTPDEEVMIEHGDDVLQYMYQHDLEMPTPERGDSWRGYQCEILDVAVGHFFSTLCP